MIMIQFHMLRLCFLSRKSEIFILFSESNKNINKLLGYVAELYLLFPATIWIWIWNWSRIYLFQSEPDAQLCDLNCNNSCMRGRPDWSCDHTHTRYIFPAKCKKVEYIQCPLALWVFSCSTEQRRKQSRLLLISGKKKSEYFMCAMFPLTVV